MRGQPGPAFGRPGCKLDPRIHLKKQSQFSKMDCRVKPGNDEWMGCRQRPLVLHGAGRAAPYIKVHNGPPVKAMQQFRIRIVALPRWRIFLLATLALAVIAAFFVLAFGIFLLMLPVFLVAGALAYLFGGRRPRPDRPVDGQTIEGEYRVIEEKRLERER